MISIFQNKGVEDLPAEETPESPIGHSRPVISFHNHQSLAAMALHGNLPYRSPGIRRKEKMKPALAPYPDI